MSVAKSNRMLLRLLAGEIMLGLVIVLIAIVTHLFAERAGQQRLFRIVMGVFQVSYGANAAGALVSPLLFARATEEELHFPRVMGHVLNWIYVVGLMPCEPLNSDECNGTAGLRHPMVAMPIVAEATIAGGRD